MHLKAEVSVIVPIYNIEKYLRQCLDSIGKQTFENIEVICVNDCSPDNSQKIVNEYLARDPRFRSIVHERNLGLGGARNTGIRAASAKYIVMPDSDDWLEPNYVEVLYAKIVAEEADIVCCSIKSTVEYSYFSLENKSFTGALNFMQIAQTIGHTAWNKIYKKSLFVDNDIFFPEHLYYQDMATLIPLYYFCQKISTCSQALFNYRIRDDSVSRTSSKKHVQDYFFILELVGEFIRQQGLFTNTKVAHEYISMVIRELKTCYHSKVSQVVDLQQRNSLTLEFFYNLDRFRHNFMQYIANLSFENKVFLLLDNLAEQLDDKLMADPWYCFGQLSRKKKIWSILKYISKKLRIYPLLRALARQLKK